MKSNFYLDLMEGEVFEKIEAEKQVGGVWKHSTKDDRGIDVRISNFPVYIDVKAHHAPRIQIFRPDYHFSDVFLECSSRGKVGWFLDDSKKTTHYTFYTDAKPTGGWYERFYVSKWALRRAVERLGDELKIYDDGDVRGILFPIELLKAICLEYERNEN